jgi:hypothetical protein
MSQLSGSGADIPEMSALIVARLMMVVNSTVFGRHG